MGGLVFWMIFMTKLAGFCGCVGGVIPLGECQRSFTESLGFVKVMNSDIVYPCLTS